MSAQQIDADDKAQDLGKYKAHGEYSVFSIHIVF
jgi:hypothetical protein